MVFSILEKCPSPHRVCSLFNLEIFCRVYCMDSIFRIYHKEKDVFNMWKRSNNWTQRTIQDTKLSRTVVCLFSDFTFSRLMERFAVVQHDPKSSFQLLNSRTPPHSLFPSKYEADFYVFVL